MDAVLTSTIALLITAIIVALIARRLDLPYTVGLVIAGIVLAVSHAGPVAGISHDFIYEVILPPLLFEAALNIHWKELRRDALPVLTLATVGTVIAAAFVAAGTTLGLGWPLPSALLFGVLIAATDPVAVIAMFKDNRLKGRLSLLVEGESLLNDAVAAVLFTLVLAWAQQAGAAPAAPAEIAQAFAVTAGGGIVVGLATSAAAILLAGRTSDHLVESTLTTVAAYGSFLLAENFHVSGVLATVTAGLVIGNISGWRGRVALHGREFVVSLWEFVAFIANSLVFLLIGLAVPEVQFSHLGALPLGMIIALVLVGRALTVYPLSLPFARTDWAISLPAQHVLWWGGLRGALGLALALALPDSVPMHDAILEATFGVVVFSTVVQALTMPLLLRRLGFIQKARS